MECTYTRLLSSNGVMLGQMLIRGVIFLCLYRRLERDIVRKSVSDGHWNLAFQQDFKIFETLLIMWLIFLFLLGYFVSQAACGYESKSIHPRCTA